MVDFPRGHRSFFVREICEPADNALRVVIAESKLLPPKTEQMLGISFSSRLMTVDTSKPSLELYWDVYVAYSVTNESYAQNDKFDSEPRPLQQMLQVRAESAFLNYVTDATFASATYPGPLSHWQLFCENHVVDVVSVQPPSLRWIFDRREFPIR